MKRSNRSVYLMYHQIDDCPSTKFYVSNKHFIQQTNSLIDEGLLGKLGSEGVVLTFDDGHKSNFEIARWLYAKGVQAVFFVIKDFSVNNPDYLSEGEIMEMAKMGHIIGVHGKNHGWWTKKTPDRLLIEIKETKDWIEGLTGIPCICCSAPGGRLNSRIVKNIREHLPEIKYIRSSRHWCNHTGDVNLNSMPVKHNTSAKEFGKIVHFNRLYYISSYLFWLFKEVVKRVVYKEIVVVK